jgi:2-oxoglutarate ferredoxin oxidoreductase subunit gamma
LLDKFVHSVKHGGVILVNSSLAKAPEDRADCKIVEIAANDIAAELGAPMAVNMVMLGAFVQLLKPVKLESIKASMTEVVPERHHSLIPLNVKALESGAAMIGGYDGAGDGAIRAPKREGSTSS